MSFGLYTLDVGSPIYNINMKRLKTKDSNETYIWHRCLGHSNKKSISKLHKDGLLDSFKNCESCLQGKMPKTLFVDTNERVVDPLGIIHSEIVTHVAILTLWLETGIITSLCY